jgi:hypothetical protein
LRDNGVEILDSADSVRDVKCVVPNHGNIGAVIYLKEYTPEEQAQNAGHQGFHAGYSIEKFLRTDMFYPHIDRSEGTIDILEEYVSVYGELKQETLNKFKKYVQDIKDHEFALQMQRENDIHDQAELESERLAAQLANEH